MHTSRNARLERGTPPRPRTGAYDVIVVGARCAGAATAMLLARAGVRVLVVDRARRGTDTLSTHALMRGAVLQLHRWGLLERIVVAGTPPVRRTTFHYGDDTVTIDLAARDGIEALYAPRRTVLDSVLADAAEEAGADVRFGMHVTGLRRGGSGRVVGIEGRDRHERKFIADAPLTIGADGTRSLVARHAGAATRHRGRAAGGLLYGYWSGVPADGYHWYFRPGTAAGLIPTNDGQVCAWVGTPRFPRESTRAFQRVFADAAPGATEMLRCGRRSGPIRGFLGTPGVLRAPAGPGWALVGDAGFYKDPLTSHGITDALRDAEFLARAVVAGRPDAMLHYARTRDALAVPMLEVTDAIASYRWDLPQLRKLHLELNAAMKAEVAVLNGLDTGLPRAAA